MAESTITAHYEMEEAVENMYDVTIFDRTIVTTVTYDPETVTKWIKLVIQDDDMNNTSLRFFGVAAKLYFDLDLNPCIRIFQICDGKRCLIFQLVNCNKDSCPPTLKSFLEDEISYGFFGINNIVSKMKLLGELLSINPKIQLVDLGEVAMERYKLPELKNVEQRELVRTTLGVNVKMPDVDHTKWSYPGRLSQVQVHYACLEAFLNLEVGTSLNNTLI